MAYSIRVLPACHNVAQLTTQAFACEYGVAFIVITCPLGFHTQQALHETHPVCHTSSTLHVPASHLVYALCPCVPQDYYDGGCRTQLVRMVADAVSGTVTSCTRVVQRTLEFPAINWGGSSGRPYSYAYFAADAVDHPRAWAPAQVHALRTRACAFQWALAG